MNISVIFSFLFSLLCGGCDTNLLVPVELDSTPFGEDTGTSPDSETELDTHTTTDSDSEPATESEAPGSDDSETASETATDSQTETEIDTGTDTYEYVDNNNFDPIGYATVPALGLSELTGGALGTSTVTVTTAEELQAAIEDKGDEPVFIYVDGEITSDTGRIRVEEHQDIHIVGVGTRGILNGVGIAIQSSANIIVRNLTIHHVENGTGDGITIEKSHHIWVDHCDIYNDRNGTGDYDGLLDITNGSDYITVSWNRFHDHVKGLIVGNSDSNADEDQNTFHITYHHNRFSNISPGALSFRFGRLHAFNNLFEFDGNDETVGISSRMGACTRAELNQMDGITQPFQTDQSGDSLETLGALQNILNDWGNVEKAVLTPTCTLEVPYEYLQAIHRTNSLPDRLDANTGIGVIPQP